MLRKAAASAVAAAAATAVVARLPDNNGEQFFQRAALVITTPRFFWNLFTPDRVAKHRTLGPRFCFSNAAFVESRAAHSTWAAQQVLREHRRS
jgi:hypothetical protein